jgi:hypothetical protein
MTNDVQQKYLTIETLVKPDNMEKDEYKKINNGTTEVLVEKYYEEVLVLRIVACRKLSPS